MKRSFLLYFIISALLLASCHTAKRVQIPDSVSVPTDVYHNSDSVNAANIAWQQFFKDQHLQTVIDSVLRNNQDMLIALQRVTIAKEQLRMAKAALLPSINAVATAGVERYGDYTMNGVGNYDTEFSENISDKQRIPTPTPDYYLGLRSSWEIDLWGKLRNRKKAAIARFAATQKGRQLIATALIAQTGTLYYELLALDNELLIVKRNTQLQEAALDIVKVQKEGGRATELAVKQFEAQLYYTKSFEYSTRQQIIALENQLRFLMGQYPAHIDRSKELSPENLPERLHTGVPSDLLLHRPDIQEAELSLQAAKADVKVARAAFLPSLTINPSVGFNAFDPSLLFNPGSFVWGIFGGLTAPVFNQKQISAAYAISIAQNKEAYYMYQKTVLNAVREVVTTMQQLEQTKKMLHMKEQQTQALQDAVSSARDLYVSGYATYLEIITAQKSALEAEIEENHARKLLFTQSIELYRALGGGSFTVDN
ncbi:TolC family protein [Taibaiella soli]|uniref:TolC family protein n=1 Tax=Taibaiella soli TaxID=1649169 RepID=A0A2W2AWC8_9BACT|nr:TolC family protein [Taibaiella soli]PZF72274.1 TolC family protein [Taibaiella soli]